MTIINNIERSRFETTVSGGQAILDYEFYNGMLALTHTYVPPQDRNNGVAFALVHFALEYAKAEHLKVIPGCSSVALYIDEHPEYIELVDPEYL
jgi:predicted GNAT family acetyltransferase